MNNEASEKMQKVRNDVGRIRCIGCYLRAVWEWLKSGVWEVHIWNEFISHRDIYSSPKGFRYADTSGYLPDETLVINAKIKTKVCIHCGKVEKYWMKEVRKND